MGDIVFQPTPYKERSPGSIMVPINSDGRDKVWENTPDYQLFNRSDQGVLRTPKQSFTYDREVVHPRSRTIEHGRLRLLRGLVPRLTFAG